MAHGIFMQAFSLNEEGGGNPAQPHRQPRYIPGGDYKCKIHEAREREGGRSCLDQRHLFVLHAAAVREDPSPWLAEIISSNNALVGVPRPLLAFCIRYHFKQESLSVRA